MREIKKKLIDEHTLFVCFFWSLEISFLFVFVATIFVGGFFFSFFNTYKLYTTFTFLFFVYIFYSFKDISVFDIFVKAQWEVLLYFILPSL